jgi:hypothetical protein
MNSYKQMSKDIKYNTFPRVQQRTRQVVHEKVRCIICNAEQSPIAWNHTCLSRPERAAVVIKVYDERIKENAIR